MDKEQVLQKVNEYCNEKSYTNETLTDEFKEQFAGFFAKRYDDADIEDDKIIADLQFNLNTAFSATSKGITTKVRAFEAKELDYKRQIEELNKNNPAPKDKGSIELPDDLKEQLAELQSFKNEQKKDVKFKEVLSLAKKNVRQDLHRSLENYAADFAVSIDESSDEQAKKLTARFQEIFKDSIGDIKPLTPKVVRQRDEEFLGTIPKVKI